MSTNDIQRDPLEELAAEFTERCRLGEQPSVESYAAKHPALASDIRDLFSMIRDVEQAKDSFTLSGHSKKDALPPLERLGDFHIIRELGRGGMGIVYEAEQESLARRVAIKVLPHHYVASPNRRERFEREARTAARLHHTNIVPIFGVGEQDGYPYFVMQYIRGVGLDAVFQRLFNDSTQRSPAGPATFSSHESARFEFGSIAAGLLSAQSSPSHVGSTESSARPRATTDSLLSLGESTHAASIHANSGRPLTGSYWRSLASLISQAADALAYAHDQGVLHRDVKPSNLLLDADGAVWITDFGLAKGLEHENITQAGDVIGTLRYMAPEQFSHQADQRSDVYSLGLTLYELATLQPAFTQTDGSHIVKSVLQQTLWPARKLCPAMPRDLETIIEKATARESAHRYASAADFRDDLRRFVEDRPIAARRISIPERVWRWSKRNPALAASSGIALGLLLAVAVVSSVAYAHVKQQRKRAEATADLAVQALDTLFAEFAASNPIGAGQIKLGDSETTSSGSTSSSSASVSVAVPPVLSKETAILLKNMLVFYRKLAQQEGGSRSLSLKMAAAQRRVGEIQDRLGDHAAARAAFNDSIRQYEQLLSNEPTSREVTVALTQLHEQLGQVYYDEDHMPEATAQLEAALAILSKADVLAQKQPDSRFELARVHYLLGRAPKGQQLNDDLNGPPGARRPGPPGVGKLFGRLLPRPGGPGQRPPPRDGADGPDGQDPQIPPSGREGGRRPPPPPDRARPRDGRPDDRPLRPLPEDRPGRRPEDRGEPPPDDRPGPPPEDRPPPDERPEGPPDAPPPGAPFRPDAAKQRAHLDQAVSILTELTKESPKLPAYRHLLAQCLRERKPIRPPLPPGANSADLDRAIDLLKGLVADFPQVPQYTFDLCEAYSSRPPGPDAGKQLEDALTKMQKLVRDHPSIPSYKFALAHLYFRLAQLARDDQRPRDATYDLTESVKLQSELAGEFPQIEPYTVAAAFYECDLARMLMPPRRWDEAKSLLESAVRRLETLTASPSQAKPHVRHLLLVCYHQLADVLRGQGDEKAALELENKARLARPELPAATQPQP